MESRLEQLGLYVRLELGYYFQAIYLAICSILQQALSMFRFRNNQIIFFFKSEIASWYAGVHKSVIY